MKNIAVAVVIILACIVIGSALGNQSGGFIVGTILAITIVKRIKKLETEETA